MTEVFRQFLWLGCVSFGGPVAHIAYFRKTFVEQKAWLSDQEFMVRLSLCNILPGPTSSQLGFAIGQHRAGSLGGIAAFVGFTLPSFMIMFVLAMSVFNHGYAQGSSAITQLIFGLKLAAVVIVADALVSMSLTFCRSFLLAALALLALLAFLQPLINLHPVLLMFLGGAAVCLFLRNKGLGALERNRSEGYKFLPKITSRRTLWLAGGAFIIFLLASLVTSDDGLTQQLFAPFYQVGASTFGGGHVVLPLLVDRLDDLVAQDTLLTAYATAQALPGPMFTIATFLGVEIAQGFALSGMWSLACSALVSTMAVFLPGFLLLVMLLPSWNDLSKVEAVGLFLAGVNAVVVGYLASAFVTFVAPAAFSTNLDLVMAMIVFILLRFARIPVLLALGLCVAYGFIRTLL